MRETGTGQPVPVVLSFITGRSQTSQSEKVETDVMSGEHEHIEEPTNEELRLMSRR